MIRQRVLVALTVCAVVAVVLLLILPAGRTQSSYLPEGGGPRGWILCESVLGLDNGGTPERPGVTESTAIEDEAPCNHKRTSRLGWVFLAGLTVPFLVWGIIEGRAARRHRRDESAVS